MDRINVIKHKGKDIHYFDFSKLASNEFIDMLQQSFEIIKKQNNALVFFNVTDAAVFGDTLKKAKEFAREIKPYRKKSVLIGINGAKKILLDSILRFSGTSKHVRAFSDAESAKDWLVID